MHYITSISSFSWSETSLQCYHEFVILNMMGVGWHKSRQIRWGKSGEEQAATLHEVLVQRHQDSPQRFEISNSIMEDEGTYPPEPPWAMYTYNLVTDYDREQTRANINDLRYQQNIDRVVASFPDVLTYRVDPDAYQESRWSRTTNLFWGKALHARIRFWLSIYKPDFIKSSSATLAIFAQGGCLVYVLFLSNRI